MPPRYSYWTILAGGLPTAFRSAEREDLLPTFARLRDRHPDAVIRWFARGKLWESPEAAKAAVTQREGRGRDWRPGGTHRDPRQPYIDAKKERNLRARHDRFENRQRGNRERDAPPAGRAADPASKQSTRPLPPGPRVQAQEREQRAPRQERPGGSGQGSWRKPTGRPETPAKGFRSEHRGPRDEHARGAGSPAGPGKFRPSWKPSERPHGHGTGFRPEARGPASARHRDDRGPRSKEPHPQEGREHRQDDRKNGPMGPRLNPKAGGKWTPKPRVQRAGDDRRPLPKTGAAPRKGDASGMTPKRQSTSRPAHGKGRPPRKGPRR